MFTGLIESFGKIIDNRLSQTGSRLVIHANLEAVQPGESIAVNGVCLTVLPSEEDYLVFDVSPETLKLTTLGQLIQGQSVNLERALEVGTRMGGHYVSGHVDTTAIVQSICPLGDFVEMTFSDFGIQAKSYLWPKGSITLDGVSLTINSVDKECMAVMLIPHTLAMTTLSDLREGTRVNVEFDYLARIIAHQLGVAKQAQGALLAGII
jgi:riboflavin synthase